MALLLTDAAQFSVEHGYPVLDAIFQATASSANRIDRIDDRPAMVVYQELMRNHLGLEVTPGNFYQYAVHYPFGLVTALGVLVRIPVGLTEDGAIYCVGEIPADSFLRLLHAPDLEGSSCTGRLVAGLGKPGTPLLTFYCAGRRMHFGADAETELRMLQASSNATDLIGAVTLGEIGTDPELGVPEFHNAAMLCVR